MILQLSLYSWFDNARAPERSSDAATRRMSDKPGELVPTGPLRLFWTLRSLRPLRPFRSLRALNSLRPVWPIHLCRASVVPPLLAVVPGHLIGPIEATEFSALVCSTILTAVFSTIRLPVFLPYITGLHHSIVIPPASTTIVATTRPTISRAWSTIRGARTAVIIPSTNATVATPIVDPFEPESIKLGPQTLPFGFR